MVVELLSSFGGRSSKWFCSWHNFAWASRWKRLLSQIVCKTSQITKGCLLLCTIHGQHFFIFESCLVIQVFGLIFLKFSIVDYKSLISIVSCGNSTALWSMSAKICGKWIGDIVQSQALNKKNIVYVIIWYF